MANTLSITTISPLDTACSSYAQITDAQQVRTLFGSLVQNGSFMRVSNEEVKRNEATIKAIMKRIGKFELTQEQSEKLSTPLKSFLYMNFPYVMPSMTLQRAVIVVKQ